MVCTIYHNRRRLVYDRVSRRNPNPTRVKDRIPSEMGIGPGTRYLCPVHYALNHPLHWQLQSHHFFTHDPLTICREMRLGILYLQSVDILTVLHSSVST